MEPSPSRIVAIDVVRGFALLGILLMNIVGMGLPSFAYLDPSYYGGASGADLWTWAINFTLTDGKMRALFTMLFGASTVLIAERAEGGRLGPAQTHYRRMFWLLLFGLAHAVLFWYGDILVCYAVAGLFVFPLRALRAPMLLTLGIGLLGALLVFSVNGAPMHRPDADAALAEIALFRGDFGDAIAGRLAILGNEYGGGGYAYVVEAIAQMLLGMGLFKTGFFSGAWTLRGYALIAAVGYLVAAPFNASLALHAVNAEFEIGALSQAIAWSGAPRPFIALAHAAALMLLLRAELLGPVGRLLAAAGRMALSNYLLTSIITAFVFCGFGLGLFGRLARFELLFVVAGVWAFLLSWSAPWLQRFHYGPFEWAWRSLVQGAAAPFKRAKNA